MRNADEAERYLASLEPIGWRLGLRRMRALCAELGNPQLRYATVHVVGTNGKTSVCRMVETLLGGAGLKAGSSVSPHLNLWRERISVGSRILAADAFVAATARVREAAAEVEVELGAEEGRLTQFEVATAIAFVALAEAGVEVAAIEAGLGGRLDASNVLRSELTVLTSIGLDHTEWLGETEEEIAAEKLAVLRPGSALLIGPLRPSIATLARRHANSLGAKLIEVTDHGEWPVGPAGRFRRIDLEIARQAAGHLLGHLRPDAEPQGLGRAEAAALAATIEIPGRLELRSGEPATIFDVAHNPQGAAALAEALSEVAPSEPVVACVALLDDKDADGFAAALAPALDLVVCTELAAPQLEGGGKASARSHPAAELAAAFTRHGLAAEAQPDLTQALVRVRDLALERGATVLFTGSHFLIASARDRPL